MSAKKIKTEPEDPEINEMAKKIRENLQRTSMATARQNTVHSLYINRNGRSETLNIPSTNQATQFNDKALKESDDSETEKGNKTNHKTYFVHTFDFHKLFFFLLCVM